MTPIAMPVSFLSQLLSASVIMYEAMYSAWQRVVEGVISESERILTANANGRRLLKTALVWPLGLGHYSVGMRLQSDFRATVQILSQSSHNTVSSVPTSAQFWQRVGDQRRA